MYSISGAISYKVWVFFTWIGQSQHIEHTSLSFDSTMPLFYFFFSITSSITQTSLTNYMFSKIKLFSDLLVVKFLPLQLFVKLMVYICYQLGLRMGTRIFKRNSCLLVFFYCVKLNFQSNSNCMYAFRQFWNNKMLILFCSKGNRVFHNFYYRRPDVSQKSQTRVCVGAGKHRIVSSM